MAPPRPSGKRPEAPADSSPYSPGQPWGSWVSSSRLLQPFSPMFCWGHEGRKGQPLRSFLTPYFLGEWGAPLSPACVWSHAAVPNSISSCSQLWTQGAGGRLGICFLAHPPKPMSFSYLIVPSCPLWWWLCPLCPVAFPCLTGNHTTQGKECPGAEEQVGSTKGPCSAPPPPGPSLPAVCRR